MKVIKNKYVKYIIFTFSIVLFFSLILNYKDKYKISINKFKNYHSKDNINYYNWQEIREFDALLSEYIY